jgi:hypothetical protein
MVNMFVSAKCARALFQREGIILVNIDGAAFSFLTATLGRITMQSVLRSSIGYQHARIRAGLRTSVSLARLWTGRARVSTATNTAIPRCVATTTHRTRVSEMRLSPSRLNCEPLEAAPLRAETFTSQRRDPGKPRHLSG